MKIYTGDKINILNNLDTVSRSYPLLISLLKENIESDIYVDNKDSLESIIIVSRMGWIYSIGKEVSDKNIHEIVNLINSNYVDSYEYLVCFGFEEKWIPYIKNITKKKAIYDPRLQFDFEITDSKPFQIKENYLIEIINSHNIVKSILFDSGITEFWSLEEDFIDNGFGFNLVIDSDIACQIISASVSAGEVEINIITSENHRRKGLAYILSSYFINYCIERNLIPKWDCREGNLSSRNLAEKLGFRVVRDYPVIVII